MKIEPTELADRLDVGYERQSWKNVDSKNVGVESSLNDREQLQIEELRGRRPEVPFWTC